MSMTREQAIAFCVAKKAEGKTVHEILPLLKAAGYLTAHGKPMTSVNGIYKMIQADGESTAPKPRPPFQPVKPVKMKTLTDTPNPDKISAIREIVNAQGLSDIVRLGLIKIIIQ